MHTFFISNNNNFQAERVKCWIWWVIFSFHSELVRIKKIIVGADKSKNPIQPHWLWVKFYSFFTVPFSFTSGLRLNNNNTKHTVVISNTTKSYMIFTQWTNPKWEEERKKTHTYETVLPLCVLSTLHIHRSVVRVVSNL